MQLSGENSLNVNDQPCPPWLGYVINLGCKEILTLHKLYLNCMMSKFDELQCITLFPDLLISPKDL